MTSEELLLEPNGVDGLGLVALPLLVDPDE